MPRAPTDDAAHGTLQIPGVEDRRSGYLQPRALHDPLLHGRREAAGWRSSDHAPKTGLSLLLARAAHEIMMVLMVAEASADVAVLVGVYWPARGHTSCVWWSGGFFVLSLLCYCCLAVQQDNNPFPALLALCPVLGGPIAAQGRDPSVAAATMATFSFPQYLVAVTYLMQHATDQAGESPPWYIFLSIGSSVLSLLFLPILSFIGEGGPVDRIEEREREAFRLAVAIGTPCVLLELLHFVPVLVEYFVYRGISDTELASYLAIFNGAKLVLLALRFIDPDEVLIQLALENGDCDPKLDRFLIERLLCDGDDCCKGGASGILGILFGGILSCALALTLPLCPAMAIVVRDCKCYMEDGFSQTFSSQLPLGPEHSSNSRVSRWNLAVVALYLMIAYGSMGAMVVGKQQHPPGHVTMVLLGVALVLVVTTLLAMTFALPAMLVHSDGCWLFSCRKAMTLASRPRLPPVAPDGTLFRERAGNHRLLRLLGLADVDCLLSRRRELADERVLDWGTDGSAFANGDMPGNMLAATVGTELMPPAVIELLCRQRRMRLNLLDGLHTMLYAHNHLLVATTVEQDEPGIVVICRPCCDLFVSTDIRQLMLRDPDQLSALTCMDFVGSTPADARVAAECDARRSAPLAQLQALVACAAGHPDFQQAPGCEADDALTLETISGSWRRRMIESMPSVDVWAQIFCLMEDLAYAKQQVQRDVSLRFFRQGFEWRKGEWGRDFSNCT